MGFIFVRSPRCILLLVSTILREYCMHTKSAEAQGLLRKTWQIEFLIYIHIYIYNTLLESTPTRVVVCMYNNIKDILVDDMHRYWLVIV